MQGLGFMLEVYARISFVFDCHFRCIIVWSTVQTQGSYPGSPFFATTLHISIVILKVPAEFEMTLVMQDGVQLKDEASFHLSDDMVFCFVLLCLLSSDAMHVRCCNLLTTGVEFLECLRGVHYSCGVSHRLVSLAISAGQV